MLVLSPAFFRQVKRNSWLREGKNWTISNTITLVWHCLSHLAQMRWVRYIPTSVVDLCLMLPSWLGSKKPLAVIWNCSLLLITFSSSLPVVLRSTIDQKELGVLYNILFGLGMTTVLADLKWEGQYSNIMHTLAICTNLSRHMLCEIKALRCLHDMWSGPRVKDDEHLAIVSISSCLENGGHSMPSAWESSLRNLVLTCLFSAEL